MTDITEGFYFVSDRKVAVYIGDSGQSPLTTAAFNEIVSADMIRNESFFEDSQITLETTGDYDLYFPVSSEHDRDLKFLEAIQSRISGKSSTRPPRFGE